MSTGYLNNLIHKSQTSVPVIQPRLKSRFESTIIPIATDTNLENEQHGELLASTPKYTTKPQDIHSETKADDSSDTNDAVPCKNGIHHKNDYHHTDTKVTTQHYSDMNIHKVANQEMLRPPEVSIDADSPADAPHRFDPTTHKESPETFGLLNQPNQNVNPNIITEYIPQIHVGDAQIATPAPPTVNVSIGRVEVKAVMATPKTAPKKPVQKSPRLSLQEYIENRK